MDVRSVIARVALVVVFLALAPGPSTPMAEPWVGHGVIIAVWWQNGALLGRPQ